MTSAPPDQDKKPTRRRARRALVWCLLCLVLIAGGAAGSVWWLKGREVAAPEWLRAQISDRLQTAVPEAEVSFGELVLLLDEEWRPRASVRNVQVTTPDGVDVVGFSEMRAGASLDALLRGQLEPTSLDVSGVFLTLRRGPEGRISISGTQGPAQVAREAPNLAELVTELDDFLLRPGLTGLERVSVQTLTLRYEDQRANRAWTIDGGRLQLTREAEALQIFVDLAVLGGGAQVATLAASYAGEIGARASEFGVTFRDLDAVDVASQGAAFNWLGALRAPISGALRGGLEEDGSIRPLNATFQIGAGVIQPTPEAQAIPIDSARSYFTYLPDSRTLRFDELSVESKWGRGTLEGQAEIGLPVNGRIGDMVGQLRLSGLTVNPADFYPEPVSVAVAELDFQLSTSPFLLEIGRLQVEDDGNVATGNGTIRADARGWEIALDGQMNALRPARLLELWPMAVKPKSRKWIAENVKAGTMRDISGAVRLRAGEEPETFLSFDFSDGEVRFLRTMPHLTGARGHATLVRNRFVVVADEGVVTADQGGEVDVTGTAFIIPDVKIKDFTPGVVRLRASGGIEAALSLLDRKPLEVMKKAGRAPDIASGRAEVMGTISLPLEKGVPLELVNYNLTGTITDVRSDVLVPDRVVQAPALDLVASDEEVSLRGEGDLDGVPFDIVWRQSVGEGPQPPGRVTGTAVISQEALDTFRVDLPPGSVRGSSTADIDITLTRDTPPALRLTSDLRGLRLAFAPVGWAKAAATPGELEVALTLGPVPQVDSLRLEAPGLRAEGDVLLNEGGTLDRVRLSRLRVGGWLDVPAELIGRGEGAPPAVNIPGGRVDLRRADFGSAGGSGQASGPLTLALDTLQVSDSIALRNLRGEFTTGGGGLLGNFTGLVNGQARIAGQVVPEGGRSAIRIAADDAGAVVAAAGVLKQGRGGQLELGLRPVGTAGALDGKLRVTDISVVDAPAIAALLNAISIVGLVNELGGDGIYFSEVLADFRLTPDRITLREASAVGSSIGLSMDGVFFPGTGQLQMQGVISPVYLLNAIGRVISRRGEGLFGFNYSISGTTQDPDVFVNPLTALVPGGIRDLFRAPKPEVPLAEGEEPPPPEPVRRPPPNVSGSDR
ncbi:hypothetical protein [Roseobacter sp. S98]|uniref:hypothetical protein n=1 Tax=Roseobacter algicola (ex Choi et al. 2025) (nom. illeg.) TaxID=3092138 RepID=UPI0035C7160A